MIFICVAVDEPFTAEGYTEESLQKKPKVLIQNIAEGTTCQDVQVSLSQRPSDVVRNLTNAYWRCPHSFLSTASSSARITGRSSLSAGHLCKVRVAYPSRSSSRTTRLRTRSSPSLSESGRR